MVGLPVDLDYEPPLVHLEPFLGVGMLYIIAGLEDPHGIAVKDELEEYYDTEIHYGRLYPNLDTLSDKGLVDKDRHDKRTNAYTLTARGHREIEDRQDWKSEYVEQVVEYRTPDPQP